MSLQAKPGPWRLEVREHVCPFGPEAFTDWRFRTLLGVMAQAWQQPDQLLPSPCPDMEIQVQFDKARDLQVWVLFLKRLELGGQVHRSIFAYGAGGRVRRTLVVAPGWERVQLSGELPSRLRPPWAVAVTPSTVDQAVAKALSNPIVALVGAWLHYGRDLATIDAGSREELSEQLGRFSIPIVGGMAPPSTN